MEYRLEELFDLQMGKTPSRSVTEYWESGNNKWISIADLSKCGKYIYDTKECLSDIAVSESGIKQIPANTVVMSFKLSIGKTAITSEPMYSNEAIMSFRDRKLVQLLPEYIYYLLLSKNWDDGTNKAVMGKTLNKATLSKVKVNIHSMQEQQEIVYVLNQATALIELHQQQLQKLDELVKARFVELFGDPLHNTKDLQTSPMTNICRIIDGDRGKNYPKQEDFSDCGFCLFLNAKNVTAQGFSFENCMYITEEKDALLHNGKLCRGDVVLTTRGTIGNLAFYDTSVPYGNVRINSGMVILRMNRNLVSEIFFMEQFKMQLDSIKSRIASGSAQPQLPISTMNKIKMILPQIELQKQFEQFVKQVDKSKVAVQKSLDEAQLLFDSLMQQYFD